MAKTRRSGPRKRPHYRILTLRELKRLPPPPPKTKERESHAKSLYKLIAGPGTIGHFLTCSHCLEEARRREDEGQLRKEAERQLRLDEFKRSMRAGRATTPKARGKLSPEALSEHIKRHPLDKRNRDGSHFSIPQRLAVLEREQSITIDRTTLTHRLGDYRRSLPA